MRAIERPVLTIGKIKREQSDDNGPVASQDEMEAKYKKVLFKKSGLDPGSKSYFKFKLMSEMTYTGEHHGKTSFVSRGDDLFVTH